MQESPQQFAPVDAGQLPGREEKRWKPDELGMPSELSYGLTPSTMLVGFGEARLIQHLDTWVDLVSCTGAGRNTVLEWLGRFMPEASLGQRKLIPWPKRN